MSNLADELKQMIIDVLVLEDISIQDIDNEAPLFNEGLGLDSIDALELGLALKKRYNIHLNAESEDTKKYFQSIQSLVQLVEMQAQAG
ncbi:phosphopantetheine-binding protein [Acinetobacter sp. MD2]|uniref:phosphopantetheine-binding protein n=1 Tax=Acinetobacter sp. MD2 TaxID=2600066 RepID=UPI002D1F8B08|nr:phosphopantetheine-binding protein [Acinetobacter sp. MD2]MEB3767073.1 acyl carrier protein [Acinetobacter sp. MD2]